MKNRLSQWILGVLFFTSAQYSMIHATNAPPTNEILGPAILVVGTRPEMIKMAPVYWELKRLGIPTRLCSTGQHVDLLQELFQIFQLQPDDCLQVMRPGQDLAYVTSAVLEKTTQLFRQIRPSVVVVQGDTASAFAAALAAFYLQIPVAHVEAGLRSGNWIKPFPEEMNRRAISLMSSLHFAPTERSCDILLREGISPERIFCTGNTVVDTLHWMVQALETGAQKPNPSLQRFMQEARQNGQKILLLTAHRRESFHGGIEQIFAAIRELLLQDPTITVFYPAHPNPAIQQAIAQAGLTNLPQLHLLPPLPYTDLVYLLHAADAVATDSGGVQEEAMSLGKRVAVLRGETDRPEGLEEGLARLTGCSKTAIVEAIYWLLSPPSQEVHPLSGYSPFGDGRAGERIGRVLQEKYFSGSFTNRQMEP